MTNPILEELYEARRQILAEHGENLDAYLQAQLEKTIASGHPVANIQQRSIRRTEPAEAPKQQAAS